MGVHKVRCRLLTSRSEMSGEYVTKVEERYLENVGDRLSLDTSACGSVQIELAPGLWLDVSVSEWGYVELSNREIQTGKVTE